MQARCLVSQSNDAQPRLTVIMFGQRELRRHCRKLGLPLYMVEQKQPPKQNPKQKHTHKTKNKHHTQKQQHDNKQNQKPKQKHIQQ